MKKRIHIRDLLGLPKKVKKPKEVLHVCRLCKNIFSMDSTLKFYIHEDIFIYDRIIKKNYMASIYYKKMLYCHRRRVCKKCFYFLNRYQNYIIKFFIEENGEKAVKSFTKKYGCANDCSWHMSH